MGRIKMTTDWSPPGTSFISSCWTNACWKHWSCSMWYLNESPCFCAKSLIAKTRLSVLKAGSRTSFSLLMMMIKRGSWWRKVDKEFWEKLPVSDKFCLSSPSALWRPGGDQVVHGVAWFGLVCVPTDQPVNQTKAGLVKKKRVHPVQTPISHPIREQQTNSRRLKVSVLCYMKTWVNVSGWLEGVN